MMVFISTLVGRILQTSEFFRTEVKGWFLALWESSYFAKIFFVVSFIWGLVRTFISMFSVLCSSIRSLFQDMSFRGIEAGGVDILAMANSVLPLDEMIALLVAWFGIYSACASIRFILSVWHAIPFKAT